MSVKRYDGPGAMLPREDGAFVHYSDYEKLIEALRLIRRHSDSGYNTEVAEAALLTAGEAL